MSGWLATAVCQIGLFTAATAATMTSSDPSDPTEYQREFEHALQSARTAAQSSSATARDLITLAESYLDAGDDLYSDPKQRHDAYEQGAESALRALALNDRDADAHFLYAANHGNAVRLGNDARALMELPTIKNHVARAIELNPDHARALQFMGGLLAELPWIFGGRADEAERLLKQAIHIDSGYTNARLVLAKLYIRQDRIEEARNQLTALLNTSNPHYAFDWRYKFKPEAEPRLQSFEQQSR